MTRNRYQFGLTLLTGFFLLATVFAVLLYALTPATPATRGPLLLTALRRYSAWQSGLHTLFPALGAASLSPTWLVKPKRQRSSSATEVKRRS